MRQLGQLDKLILTEPQEVAAQCGVRPSSGTTDRAEGRLFHGDSASVSLKEIRNWICEQVEQLPIVHMDVLLAASELVTNVVRHAPGEFQLAVLPCDDGLFLAVTDTWPEVSPVQRNPSESETQGRGIRIVAKVSERWGVAAYVDHKTVWAMFPYTCAAGTLGS